MNVYWKRIKTVSSVRYPVITVLLHYYTMNVYWERIKTVSSVCYPVITVCFLIQEGMSCGK